MCRFCCFRWNPAVLTSGVENSSCKSKSNQLCLRCPLNVALFHTELHVWRASASGAQSRLHRGQDRVCEAVWWLPTHTSTLASRNDAWEKMHGQTVDGHTMRRWMLALQVGKTWGRPSGGHPRKVEDAIYLDTEHTLEKDAEKVSLHCVFTMPSATSGVWQDKQSPPSRFGGSTSTHTQRHIHNINSQVNDW